VAEEVGIDSGTHLLALGALTSEKLLVFGGALPGVFFFFFDLGGFGFELGLCGFDFFVAGVGVDHQLENLVFVGGDLFLGELNFVEQRFVLVVGRGIWKSCRGGR
jgi:hypothetical protein